jgi:hypothetical protein
MKLIVAFSFLISAWADSPFNRLDLFESKAETNKLPFILSNEKLQEELLLHLSEIPAPKNGVHIGWSVEMNYKILGVRRPKLALLCDISSKVIEFYDLFKKLILNANSGAEVLENIPFALRENPHLVRYGNYKPYQMEQLIHRYASFLLANDNFTYLKEMYLEGKIKHVLLNVTDGEGRFCALAKWLKDEGYVVDTLYTSNILEVIRNKKAAIENLQELISLETLHIYADNNVKLKIKSSLN